MTGFRGITVRSRLWLSDKDIVEDLNRFLRGWAGYFRFGNSSDAFRKIRQYALERLARFVAKRHGRRRGWGLMQVARFSPDNYGLIRLDGTVVAPRISTYWAGRTAECRR